MRILHVGKYYHPFRGGMESIVKDICEGLAIRNWKIDVLCANEGPMPANEVINQVQVHRMARWGVLYSQTITPQLLFLPSLAKNYDMVHIHSPNPMAELMALKIPAHIPVVATYHSDIIRQKKLKLLYTPLQKAFLRRLQKIYVPTENHIKFSEVLPLFRDKCEIIPFGINPNQFPNNSRVKTHRESIKKEFGRYALFVGRLVGYKGVDILIKAAQEVDQHILIIGSGPKEGEWRRLCLSAGVAARVHFLGKIEDVDLFSAYMRQSEMLILPSISNNENFGVVQIEAMSCSIPVICSDLESGVSAVGEHGKTGFLFPPGDYDALAKNMNILFNNEALAAEMGKNAKKHFLERYTLETMINAHENSYRQFSGDEFKKKTVLAA